MTKRVAVIGGGVIGLCSAYYLLERGHSVTVIERGAEDHDSCALGSAGMIVPSHIVPLASPGAARHALGGIFNPKSPVSIRRRMNRDFASWGYRFLRSSSKKHVARSAPLLRDLHLASRKLFEELADRTQNEFALQERGLMVLAKTRHALDEEAKNAELATRLGIPVEVVTPARAAELDPCVRMEIVGGVYYPLDCHLTPERFLATVTRLAKEKGAEFLWSTEATGFRDQDERIAAVTVDRNHGLSHEIRADEFVLAAGAVSSPLVKTLGLRLPMEAGKGYSLTLPNPRHLPSLCSILAEAHVAVTPMGPTLRVAGTMEFSGFDPRVRQEQVQGIIKAIPQYFPNFRAEDFEGIRPWYGFRPCSPDGLPYIGRFAKYRNLSVATGHAMMGLSLGPITGKLVAEIISGDPPSVGIENLSPGRFR